MCSEKDKAQIELKVFQEFVHLMGLSVDSSSINKYGNESEPDIFCKISDEEMFFELVEICAEDVVIYLSKVHRGKNLSAIPTHNPTQKILKNKLNKRYKTKIPIELLCYTSARVIPTDEQILEEIRRCACLIDEPYRKIWFLGEKDCYQAWKQIHG